jgi:hypothetical protein
MLTDTEQILEMQQAESLASAIQEFENAMAIEAIQEQVTTEATIEPLRTLDTHGLMRNYYVRQTMEILPSIVGAEVEEGISRLLEIPEEAQRLLLKTPLGTRLEQIERFKRMQDLKPVERLLGIERLKLDRPAVMSLEQTILSMLESLLYTTRYDDVNIIMQELMAMVEERRRYARIEPRLEALTKHLLQQYMPYFMEPPQEHNMIGLRLSLMTMQWLKNKSVTLYATMAGQGQTMKQKAELMSCEPRQERQKSLALLKKELEWFNVVLGLTGSKELKLSDNVPLFPDFMGKPIVTVTLLQVASMRFLLTDNYSKVIGFPENKWYLVYPRIEVIITRTGVRMRRRMRVPEWYYTNFRRDEYLKNWSKWDGTHG